MRLTVWLLCAVCLSACRPAPETPRYEPVYSAGPGTAGQRPVYVLAIHPLHAPKRLFEVYQPLVDYLNARLNGATVQLEASGDYGLFEAKLARRDVALALPNPYQTIQSAQYGYRVFAKMGDDDSFRGVILVRRDSGIAQPGDLVGKTVSYPAPTALAATLMPQWLLHQQGINVLRDLDNRYVGTQESAIMNVALGRSAAGAVWLRPWNTFQQEHPEQAARLEVKWETPPLVNNGLVARDDVPPALVAQIATLLTGLQDSPEGRAILARIPLSRFEAANDASYLPVRDFISRFEKEVRPVKPKD